MNPKHITPTQKVASDNTVIYCRVSSDKQVKEGNGLGAQEHKCRQEAKRRGWKVIKMFHDEGITGATADRSGIFELLDFLEKQNTRTHVLIYDLSRLARDVVTHHTLRKAIRDAGGDLAVVTFELDNSDEGEFIETIIAASAALDRKKGRSRVVNSMTVRAEQGIWPLPVPLGYKQGKHPMYRGKIPLVDPEFGPAVKSMLEGFANGRFVTPRDACNYLSTACNKKMQQQRVTHMLRNPLYAGIINIPSFNVMGVIGKHEPLISVETHRSILEKLNGGGGSTPPPANKISYAYPLVGFIRCPACGSNLRGSAPRGRNGTYHPYYHCSKKGCPLRNKTTPKAKVEEDFINLLAEVTPQPEMLKLAEIVMLDVWENKMEEVKTMKKTMKDEQKTFQSEIERTVDTMLVLPAKRR